MRTKNKQANFLFVIFNAVIPGLPPHPHGDFFMWFDVLPAPGKTKMLGKA
jgi:hypothetical protein